MRDGFIILQPLIWAINSADRDTLKGSKRHVGCQFKKMQHACSQKIFQQKHMQHFFKKKIERKVRKSNQNLNYLKVQ